MVDIENKEDIIKASKCFRKMADLYDELADLYDEEETKENEDKMATIIGKIMMAFSEMQSL